MSEPFQTLRLTKNAGERTSFPTIPRVLPAVSPRHVTQQPDRRPQSGDGGNFTLTIISCDGGADATLNFVNGLLTNNGSATVYSGCGGGDGGSA